MKPADYITGLIIIGCFILLQFGRDDVSKTAGNVLISVVAYHIGRKIEKRNK